MADTVNQQIVRALLADNPQISSSMLSRIMRARHPEVWTTDNAAILAVRRARGAQGEARRADSPPMQVRPVEEVDACERWGSAIPKEEPTEWGWRELPSGIDNWLIMADVHLPHHDSRAIEAMLEYADGRCDGVLILGDFVDAYQISSFCRDPRVCNMQGEIEAACMFLDALKQLKPKAIVWRGANHEARLQRYLQQRAPELFPAIANSVTWESLCGLKERDVTWIQPQDPIRVGHLSLLHGDEYRASFASPVNPARGMYLRAHGCVLSAHQHQTSEHTDPDIRGVTVTCWSIGCLCRLNPLWNPLNRWNHGFAELDLTGPEWRVANHRIINNRVL